MKKPIYRDLLVVVGLVVIVSGAVLIYKNKSPLSVAVCDNNEYVISTKKVSFNEKTDLYEIKADVPRPDSAQLETYIHKIVNERIEGFRKGVSQPSEGDIASAPGAQLELQGDLVTSTAFVNYKLLNYVYTGGAHGMPLTETFSFSRANPTEPIMFEDLFVNNDAFLPIVTSSVIPQIMAKYKDIYADSTVYTIEDLTQALTQETEWSDYFQNFVLTDEGITFIFSAYSIAPYSEGEPEITVPWSVVESILSDKMKELNKVCAEK